MIQWSKYQKEWKQKEPKQKIFMAIGLVFLLTAVTSIFVPILPQVPFALLSAYFFAKSSRRLHKRIRQNKYLGQPVRNWEDHHVIRPKLKIIAELSLLVAIGLSHWKLELPWSIALDALLLISGVFILTRPNYPTAKTLLRPKKAA